MNNTYSGTIIDYLNNHSSFQFPVTAQIEVSKKCNMKCEHCYINNKKKEELGLEELKNVVLNLKKNGTSFITFTGGEPFLMKGFMDLLQYTSDIGIGVRIFTNASLITKSIAEKLSKLNILTVDISLYGHDSDSYGVVTKNSSSFKQVISGIKNLEKYNIPFSLRTLITSQNIGEYEMYQALADTFEKEISLNCLISPNDSGSMEFVDKYKLSVNEIQWILEKQPFVSNIVRDIDLEAYVCEAGRDRVFIDSFGDVFPCIQLRKKFGNVRESSIKEICKIMISDDLVNTKLIDLKECSKCKDIEYCGQICFGLPYTAYGNITDVYLEQCKIAQCNRNISDLYANSKSSTRDTD